MKKIALAASALTVAASMASAGEIERRGDPSQILFEDGKNYLEFSFASVQPTVSGSPLTGLPGSNTGNIQENYLSFALGYKHQLNDKVALAFTIDEPVGASVDYSTAAIGAGGAFFGTSNAEVSSISYTAMAKYQINERFSAYGGLRIVGLGGDLTVVSPATGPITAGIPSPGAPYTLNVSKDYQVGYLLGAAYEIPDIALRVALTYESKTEHDFRDNNGDKFQVELPQAVTLHAQSGIAANTLLFGSVKWREWTKFQVAPDDFFSASGAPIAAGTSDIWTYELGLGRRFNENWSGAAIIGYEHDQGDTVGNLSGKDGYISYGLAMTYETEAWKVTTGIRYIEFGNADTSVVSFTNNDAIAVGMKVGFKF